MTKKIKRINLKLNEKIENISSLLKRMDLNIDEGTQIVIDDLLQYCKIGKDLAQELKHHPGVFGYLSMSRQGLQENLDALERGREKLKQLNEDSYEVVLNKIREFSPKLTAEQKKEVCALIREGQVTTTEFFHNISDERAVKAAQFYCEKILTTIKLLEKLGEEISDLKVKLTILDQVINTLAFQKNMSLRALVDMELQEFRQSKEF